MRDIIADDAQTKNRAQELGIEPLILGEDVTLAKNRQEATNATTLLVLATSPERELLEANIDGVTHIETAQNDDFMHHRRSGLEQVRADILHDKNAAIILSMHALRTADNQAQVLGRMQQNARIAKKHDVPLILASFAHTPDELPSTHDQHAFWRAMGIDEKQIAESQEALADLIAQAQHRASDSYVAEGVSKTS